MAIVLPFAPRPPAYDSVAELDSEHPLFVDWLTIRQEHHGIELPRLTGGQIIVSNEKDEVERCTQRRFEAEGSFDDRMWIRCDGTAVDFHGNPARWNRPDNVFGHGWEETISRVNRLLNLHNLPPFTKGEMQRFSDSGWQWSGARVSRIDITMNHAFFSNENAQIIVDHMGRQHVGRQRGTVTPDRTTVLYGYGSQYASGKLYMKAAELKAHRRKKSGSHVDQEVVDYCENLGVLREELTLKSRFLTQKGIAFLADIDQGRLMDIYNERSQLRALKRYEHTDLSCLSPAQRGTLARWESGEPLNLKKSQFYAHRRALLPLGVDIGTPKNNVTKLVQPIRVIERAVLVAPDWYRQKNG